MENQMKSSSRSRYLWLAICIFLVLLCCAKAENKTVPTRNVNLSPFQQWRSAFFCLQIGLNNNTCKDHYALKLDGIIQVNGSDRQEYCKGGCAQLTRTVLHCISQVKRDFWFANGANVTYVNDTINNGCSNNVDISTLGYKSSGMRNQNMVFMPLVSALLFILMFSY